MQTPLTQEQAIRIVITSNEILNVTTIVINGRDYGSGRSFITSPVAIYFSAVMSNHEVIHIEFRASMEEC